MRTHTRPGRRRGRWLPRPTATAAALALATSALVAASPATTAAGTTIPVYDLNSTKASYEYGDLQLVTSLNDRMRLNAGDSVLTDGDDAAAPGSSVRVDNVGTYHGKPFGVRASVVSVSGSGAIRYSKANANRWGEPKDSLYFGSQVCGPGTVTARIQLIDAGGRPLPGDVKGVSGLTDIDGGAAEETITFGRGVDGVYVRSDSHLTNTGSNTWGAVGTHAAPNDDVEEQKLHYLGFTFTGNEFEFTWSGKCDYFVSLDLMSFAFTQPAHLIYDANGGTGSTKGADGAADQEITVAKNAFTRKGYTFTGWSTAADASKGKPVAVGSQVTLAPGTTTLYAQWKANAAHLVYDPNGGQGSTKGTDGVTDQKVTVSKNGFTRNGYSFTGWDTKPNGDGRDVAEGSGWTLTPGTTTLYAQWKANAAHLIYDPNGGTGTTRGTDGVTDQKVTVAKNAFTRDGYTFTGWETKPSGDGRDVAEGSAWTLTPGTTTLYAQWKANAAHLVYDPNGGQGATKGTDGVTDQKVTVAKNGFTRNGYTFTGWDTKPSGDGRDVAEGSSWTLTPGTTTLYAQWKANAAHLVYDPNGGQGSTKGTDGVTDQKVTVSKNGFTRKGYTFTGWSKAADASKGKPVAVGSQVTLAPGTTTLYAQWSADPASLIYEANGGQGTTPATTGKTDQKTTVATNRFTRSGYTFTGWIGPDDTKTKVNEGQDWQLAAGTHKLTATWKADPAHLAYDPNGGQGTMSRTDGVTDQTVTVAKNGFTRNGYTFTGWNRNSDATGKDIAENSKLTLTPGITTLYATWKADPSQITYNPNGGDGEVPPTTGVTDQDVAISGGDPLHRDGYTFKTWQDCDSDTIREPGSNLTLPAGGTELCAVWEADPAQVTYRPNGGEGITEPTEGATDQEVRISQNGYTRIGYTFTGWNTSEDGTGDPYEEEQKYTLTPGETVLYAQWEANPAQITYHNGGGDGNMDPTPGVTDQTVTVSKNKFKKDGHHFTGWQVCTPTNTRGNQATSSPKPTADATTAPSPETAATPTAEATSTSPSQVLVPGADVKEGAEVTLPAGGIRLCATWTPDPAPVASLARTGAALTAAGTLTAGLTAAGVVILARRTRRQED